MNPRTTGILFVVAAALAAFVYFYEIGGEQERKDAEEAEKKLFAGLEADAIGSIELSTTDAGPVRIDRAPDGEDEWRITSPLDFPADGFAADGIASALANLISESVVEDPSPLAAYGLDSDLKIVRFTAGGTEHALRTGNATPVGSNTYAAVEGNDAVYIVASHRVSALQKALGDLRDKRIAHFDAGSARSVTASWPDGEVTLVRDAEDADWRLIAPLEGPADGETVDQLVSTISYMRADGFLDHPSPEDLAGLDPPEFRVRIVLAADAEEGGEAPEPEEIEVAFGGIASGAGRVVRGAAGSLFTVPAERLEDFSRTTNAYRYRQIAKFTTADAKRVEIGFTAPEGATFQITATKNGVEWTASPDPIREGKLARLVSELSRLRADDILADAMGPDELAAVGLEPPNAVVSVFGEGDAPEDALGVVYIGSITNNGIAARVPDRETVYLLDESLAEHIPATLEAYRNHFVAEDEPEPDAEPPATPAPESEPQ